jgi:hypothetical protein
MLQMPKKRGVFSPVLLELVIVILFFALSTGVIVRLIAAADLTAQESSYESRAILALQSVAEQIKADPLREGACNECGAVSFSVVFADDLTVEGIVTSDESPLRGTLYDIELLVRSPKGELYALDAARYVPDAEVAP